MKKNEMTKLSRRQYIWSFIDSALVTFLFIVLTQVIFAPYGTNDYKAFGFYLCILNAIIITLLLHGIPLRRLVRFIRNKESMPE